jgi:ATP-dependent helicase/nuclease subunit A
MDGAGDRQRQASDPRASTWLLANAGSGKTKVLIDRVVRLLLDGADPAEILCLTYTRAAAAEMQNRLFKRLGEMAMAETPALQEALAAIGHTSGLSPERMIRARQLFARAIEVPGGLRIQTIHSFCAMLLRRFPLEARVTPGFAELDDRSLIQLRRTVADDLIDRLSDDARDGLARLIGGADVDDFLGQIAQQRHELTSVPALSTCLVRVGLPPDAARESLVAGAFDGGEQALFKIALTRLNSPAEAIAAMQADDAAHDEGARYENLAQAFLKQSGDDIGAPKTGSIPHQAAKALRAEPWVPDLHAFMHRLSDTRDQLLAYDAAVEMVALARFALPWLEAVAQAKERQGVLDFDDLIDRAVALLRDPSVSAWVLYKLDGGLRHVLVDEAQDTSPPQWRIIQALVDETLAAGQRDGRTRSLFVVGDRKQSIYSFQGADLSAFDDTRADFAKRLAPPGPGLQAQTLLHSFRSSPAILRAVDAVFRLPSVADHVGGAPEHISIDEGMPGRVDLWPAEEKPAKVDNPPWFDPSDILPAPSAESQLAERIATFIADTVGSGTAIPIRGGGARPAGFGDVLILVQRRSDLFQHIIAACKARGLPMAGADRLRVGGELAVKDLTALLSFLATDADDLSLAAVLKSPLFGWDEDRLFRLAHGRPGLLWQAFRADPDHDPAAFAVLTDLRDQADFLRPHDLLIRALIRHDGRRRLLARLGDEAADGIDLLVDLALQYETQDVPSLTGFLTYLAAQEASVKRAIPTDGGLIRVMTVHAAKGLEAPIVILPDCANRKEHNVSGPARMDQGGVAMLRGKARSPRPLQDLSAARREAAMAERSRQLYVAMTRAQSWLIVAAAGDVGKDLTWYRLVSEGLGHAGAELGADGALRLSHGTWPSADPAPGLVAPTVDIPGWADSPAPPTARPAAPVSPSAFGGAKALPSEAGLPAEFALAYGRVVHALLEHPGAPAFAGDLPEDLMTAAQVEAARVLESPALQRLFGPDTMAEVPLTANLRGRRMVGTIDRLIVTDTQVTCVDFKTNRAVPDLPQSVPDGILAQLGAYLVALEQIFPERDIRLFVLWTATAQLMPIPHDILRQAVALGTIP